MDGDDDTRAYGKVEAERDAYAAGRDINFYGTALAARPVERQLAELALKQAQDARARLIGTDVRGDDTANVGYAQIPGRFREPGGRAAGDLRTILEYYRSLSPRRLVVIGAPGAGKTVLLLELQIRLLERRRTDPSAPVPVLVSASAFDPRAEWEDWLAGEVSLRFSIPGRTAADLVSGGRILPMVDGLDEMDPAGDASPERAQALVRALNESMRGLERAPAVVTSRPGECRLAEDIDKARHVELSGLTGGEAAAYLRGQFRTAPERSRWKRVLRTLERDPDGPLTAELGTPWRLTLALAAFRSGGDPAWLLPPPGITGSSYSANVDRMLLDGYVPSAVSLHKGTAPYTDPDVRRWLTNLTDGLARQSLHGRPATDITLHDWGRPGDKWTAQLPYAVLIVLPALVCMATGAYLKDPWVAMPTGILAICALSTSRIFLPRTRDLQQVTNRPGATARVRLALTAGIAAGITAGLAAWFMFGLTAWAWHKHAHWAVFKSVLGDGLIYGFSFGLAAGVTMGVMYRLTHRRTHWWMAGAIGALTGGLVFGLATGLAMGLRTELTTEFMRGLPKEPLTALESALTVGLENALTVGPLIGLMNGLADGLANLSPKVRRPRTVIRANGLAGLAGVLAGGLTGVLAVVLSDGLAAVVTLWLTYEFANGPTLSLPHSLTRSFAYGSVYVNRYWLAYGLLYGLTFGMAISVRTYIVVMWNAVRGRGPLRFGKFLDWTVEAGLLRESGVSYQFRHRQLQDWLTPANSASRHKPGRKNHPSRPAPYPVIWHGEHDPPQPGARPGDPTLPG